MKKIIVSLLLAACLTAAAGCTGNQQETAGNPNTTNTETSQQAADSPTNAPSVEPAVSLDDAKAIALEKAGVAEADATFTKEALESDDGITCYEFEFTVGTEEYDVQINADTGEIMEYDSEPVNS